MEVNLLSKKDKKSKGMNYTYLLLLSRWVVSNFLQLHRLRYTRLPCPSLSPGACSNSYSLCHWCHLHSHPLLPPSPPALNLSPHQNVFHWVDSWHQVAKVLELQHQFFHWIGLISFRIHWFDLLAVQGSLKSLLQYHSSKASILWHSAFFIVQLSHPYMNSGKTIALTIWTFVGKVVSLLFNMLFRFFKSFFQGASVF